MTVMFCQCLTLCEQLRPTNPRNACLLTARACFNPLDLRIEGQTVTNTLRVLHGGVALW